MRDFVDTNLDCLLDRIITGVNSYRIKRLCFWFINEIHSGLNFVLSSWYRGLKELVGECG